MSGYFSLPAIYREDEELELNSGRFTRLHLRVRCECLPGQTVHVSGSSLAAGQANPQAALEMVTTPGEEFVGSLSEVVCIRLRV